MGKAAGERGLTIIFFRKNIQAEKPLTNMAMGVMELGGC